MSKKFFAAAAAALMVLSAGVPAFAQTVGGAVRDNAGGQVRQGVEFFEKGMYSRARALFDSVSDKDAFSEGMSTLCSVYLKEPGYEKRIGEYASRYPFSGLLPSVRFRYGLNLFDEEDFEGALEQFSSFREERISEAEKAEFLFKKAYCQFETGNADRALSGFAKVDALPLNDFTAPARYTSGMICYENGFFKDALGWFEQSVKDPRFEEISTYYIAECRFMLKDYAYVSSKGPGLYAKVPDERKAHLARMISESFLLQGDAASAKEYYDKIGAGDAKGRGDYFYAGSLLYALDDYQGAIDNYSKMTDRSDSLGQVANYQMGFSYIQTKNKVAAMQAFKDAAGVAFDKQMQEDAYYNWAKLSFDLNNDGSVFENYIGKYGKGGRGDQIYSYMALAALYNHDYAGAVAAYDNIDELDPNMRNNYMKANYLRANQLIGSGSWRSAAPCLKAAAYYADRHSGFNQLARYWLAESYYRDDQFAQARALYSDLYNISALDGKAEGKMIPLNIAYCYFKEGNYDLAVKWFDEYLKSGDKTARKDAMVRKGDCAFVRKAYAEAADAYLAAVRTDNDPDDVYPYYQAGMAYGLLEQVDKKISTLSTVRRASPDAELYPDALYELGRSYMAAGQDEQAVRCFQDLMKSSSDKDFSARALLGLGMIERNRSQYDSALSYYKKVVEQMPSSTYSQDAMLAIESIYQSRQEPEKFLAYVESLGNSAPQTDADKEDLLFNAAEQIFLAENYAKALVSLQAYEDRYPKGSHISQTQFYMAESYKNLGKKEQACDYYKKVIDGGEGSFVELSALNFANLSYGMEHFAQAYGGYQELAKVARLDNNKYAAAVGMMRSAYHAKDYGNAILCADKVAADARSDADARREAQYVKAKSLLSSSERSAAFKILETLAAQPTTPEGAEAAYLVIQDSYDQGRFAEVEKKVYAFSDAGSGQTYWLAKSFILLGDSFVEREDYKQARATFESIRDGYTGEDDVQDNVRMRLGKLSEMGK